MHPYAKPSYSFIVSSAALLCFVFGLSIPAYSDDDPDLKRGVGVAPFVSSDPATKGQGNLLDALCLGEFQAKSVDDAFNHPFIDETVKPMSGTRTSGIEWAQVHNDAGIFRHSETNLQSGGPFFATYYSFWIYTPRSITVDQHVAISYLAASKAKMFLNGRPIVAAVSNAGADFRTFDQYQDIELSKGWSHFLVKVAGGDQDIDKVQQQSSLYLYVTSDDNDALSKLKTAVAVKPASN
jgi:hypothetical protein